MRIDELELMNNEWAAWGNIIASLKRLHIDLDDEANKLLAAQLIVWGELLVQLRVTQDEEVRANARKYALERLLDS
jgi:hypothetical protein